MMIKRRVADSAETRLCRGNTRDISKIVGTVAAPVRESERHEVRREVRPNPLRVWSAKRVSWARVRA